MTFWAKTIGDAQPGLSVSEHCTNVGCVAEAMIGVLPEAVRALVPPGAGTLAALHDVGKISCGFQAKCEAWLVQQDLAQAAAAERWKELAESDHAKISQWFLARAMQATGTQFWGFAAGVHHGRIFDLRLRRPACVAEREDWEEHGRQNLLHELSNVFGPLPAHPPRRDSVDLWCVAGLISVADWIGSNEAFFPSAGGLKLADSRRAAARALQQIGWSGGAFRDATFPELFGGFAPNRLQTALHERCASPGLFIVEGPMGCGKTEAALWAAQRLIASGANDGLYFALPTQVTSNRIHERVASFLRAALADAATLRLAHGASWLEDGQTIRLRPTTATDAQADEHVREGRSWFASAKHALLARYGVGTIDQALQGVVAVKHFFVRRFGLAGKVVILDEVHGYDVYTGTLLTHLVRELLALRCSVIILSATLTRARRQELIAAAIDDGASQATSAAYPLVTVAKGHEPLHEAPVDAEAPRRIELQLRAFSETELLEECISRAENGQHVLYLRNTVAEAQSTCQKLIGSIRADRAEVGLLHSRFPFFRRQHLEDFWLRRLGKKRDPDAKGSLLVATQVVEQSVDIDLDFIVTDLAPTDMLLQRMGRLWRHERPDRRVAEPVFWINAPALNLDASSRELKMALGKSAHVYQPYVLLRTREVFADRRFIALPDQIREVLEATYAERAGEEETAGRQELRAALETDREEQRRLANSATKVFGQQAQQDAEGLLTRRNGAPTRDVILLRGCEPLSAGRWRVTPLEGEPLEVSAYEWNLSVARLLHRHLVRAPLYAVPQQTAPQWLALHVRGGAAWALVREGDERCHFPEAEQSGNFKYSPLLGLYMDAAMAQDAPPAYNDDDDEFDN